MIAVRPLLLIALAGACAALVACGAEPEPISTAPRPPPGDPEYPADYLRWTPGPEPVVDEAAGERRTLYRDPDARARGGRYAVGARLVKVHGPLGAPGLVSRIDVREKTGQGPYDGWRYRSFDPASRTELPLDAEGCHLCHAAAPDDGTFTVFR